MNLLIVAVYSKLLYSLVLSPAVTIQLMAPGSALAPAPEAGSAHPPGQRGGIYPSQLPHTELRHHLLQASAPAGSMCPWVGDYTRGGGICPWGDTFPLAGHFPWGEDLPFQGVSTPGGVIYHWGGYLPLGEGH